MNCKTKTQLENDIDNFPFWSAEYQRVFYYWEMAQEGHLPWVFVANVLGNYLNAGIIPSLESVKEVIFFAGYRSDICK